MRIRLAVLTLFLILLLTPEARALTVSREGSTIRFSGSLTSPECTSGWSNLRMLLQEPGGLITPLHSKIDKKGHVHGTPPFHTSSTEYNFSGTIRTNRSWPAGKYRIIADLYYSCYWFYRNRVAWRNDMLEDGTFTLGNHTSWEHSKNPKSGWKETVLPAKTTGYYRKTFHFTGRQTDLVVTAHRAVKCWVNSHQLGSVQGRVDITEYLEPGRNMVSCRLPAGYERVCKNDYEDCGCRCRARPKWCATLSPYFFECGGNAFCTYKRYRGLRCYVPARPRFHGAVAAHREEDILWSNDNSNWYYSQLPVEESTTWYEKPDYYEDGKVYEGIRPFESVTYFKKHYFIHSSELPQTHILYASALTEPSCTLNNRPLTFEPNEDDWWVWRANTTLQSGLNQVLCTVRKNDYYGVFDLKLVPLSAETFTNLTTPFQFTPGQSQDSESRTLPIPPEPPTTPSAPLGAGAAAAAAGSVAVAAFLSRRRSRLSKSKSTKSHFSSLKVSSKGGRPKPQEINQSHLTKFLSKVAGMRASFRERLADIRRSNRSWNLWKRAVRRFNRQKMAVQESILMGLFLSRLTGSPQERARKIRNYILSRPLSSQAAEKLNILREEYLQEDDSGQTQPVEDKKPVELSPLKLNPVLGFILNTYSHLNAFGRWVYHNPWEVASYISMAGIALLGIGVAAEALAGGTATGAAVASAATTAGRVLVTAEVFFSTAIVGIKLLRNGKISEEDATCTVISFATEGFGLALRPVFRAIKPVVMKSRIVRSILKTLQDLKNWDEVSENLPRFLQYAGNAIISEVTGKPVRRSLREKNKKSEN